jgi:hypothetical protein
MTESGRRNVSVSSTTPAKYQMVKAPLQGDPRRFLSYAEDGVPTRPMRRCQPMSAELHKEGSTGDDVTLSRCSLPMLVMHLKDKGKVSRFVRLNRTRK